MLEFGGTHCISVCGGKGCEGRGYVISGYCTAGEKGGHRHRGLGNAVSVIWTMSYRQQKPENSELYSGSSVQVFWRGEVGRQEAPLGFCGLQVRHCESLSQGSSSGRRKLKIHGKMWSPPAHLQSLFPYPLPLIFAVLKLGLFNFQGTS